MGGLEVVDGRYRALYERAIAVLGDDKRVAQVELSGSVGAGTADAWSDLDLYVVTRPEHHDEFLAEWPEWLGRITPTVFARTPIAPFVINAVTEDGLTLDLAVWSGQAPSFPAAAADARPQYTVGMLSNLRFDDVGAALEYAVAEQLRGMAGPFISLVQREEHVRHLAGVPHLLGLLTTVFLAETGAPPPGKHWNRTYTEEQRAAIASLPPVAATRDDLMAFGLAVARLVVERARPLYPRFGLSWPAPLAAAAGARVRDCLGVDSAGWLY